MSEDQDGYALSEAQSAMVQEAWTDMARLWPLYHTEFVITGNPFDWPLADMGQTHWLFGFPFQLDGRVPRGNLMVAPVLDRVR